MDISVYRKTFLNILKKRTRSSFQLTVVDALFSLATCNCCAQVHATRDVFSWLVGSHNTLPNVQLECTCSQRHIAYIVNSYRDTPSFSKLISCCNACFVPTPSSEAASTLLRFHRVALRCRGSLPTDTCRVKLSSLGEQSCLHRTLAVTCKQQRFVYRRRAYIPHFIGMLIQCWYNLGLALIKLEKTDEIVPDADCAH